MLRSYFQDCFGYFECHSNSDEFENWILHFCQKKKKGKKKSLK